jgi:DNA polymerase type B, organellar and viral
VLTPIDRPAKRLRHTAYDLEWNPQSLETRLVGVFDDDGYRSYRTLREFLNGEMTHNMRGRHFFAHAGGSFDVQFVLEEIMRDPSFQVEASFSGSAAVIVRVLKDKHKWTFVDSYFLMRDSLEKIGKAIGLEKLKCVVCAGKDEKCTHMFDAPMKVLREYNRRDCEIVHRAVSWVQDQLLELGGELRPTIASCGMALFRRNYLKRSIRTSGKINEVLREAYCASRVEVVKSRAKRAEYYDINSSFPHSMTKPQPADLLMISNRFSPPTRGGRETVYFAEVDVCIPPMYLPPLPMKLGGRIFFPIGSWTGWYSKTDLELLERVGGKIEKVHRVYEYQTFQDLENYVTDIYERKRNASHAFIRLLFKYLLNCLYGKFGERTVKDTVLVRPDHIACIHKRDGKFLHPDPPHEDSCMQIISPGIWRRKDEKEVPHAHVAISANVTSQSRALLYGYLEPFQDQLCYLDTDSEVLDGRGPHFPIEHDDQCVAKDCDGCKLGSLKHEGTIKDAHFVSPKVYAFTDSKSGKRVIKSKGFRRLGPDEFNELAAFRPVEIERMRGIKEGLATDGTFGPEWARSKTGGPLIKRLHSGTLPKRMRTRDGASRPWDVEELYERH